MSGKDRKRGGEKDKNLRESDWKREREREKMIGKKTWRWRKDRHKTLSKKDIFKEANENSFCYYW